MPEQFKPESEKTNEVEEGLKRLGGLIKFIGETQHSHNKIDGLAEFEEVEQDLISKGHFASEEEIIKVLEDRGVKNSAGILEIIRAVKGE